MLCARVSGAQYQVQSWTTDNGLPHNIVGSIQQTRDGYIWMATFDGLVRFDGVRFTVFDRNNSPGIRNNRFTSLYEAADGAIWAGTEGSGVTRYAQGVFTTYTTEDGLTKDIVRAVSGDAARRRLGARRPRCPPVGWETVPSGPAQGREAAVLPIGVEPARMVGDRSNASLSV